MALTQQERIEIVLMSGERSTRVIAADFNARHPERNDISHMTVSKLLDKFRATGSVVDKPRSGRPRTATDEETATAIVASVVKSPHRSTRRLSAICGVSQRSILRVLHAHQWHPYKLQLQHHLSEDDPDRRVQFAEWALDQCNRNPNFIRQVLFSDEANFYVQGEVNKQNHRYWSDANPSWVDPCKGAGGGKVMVWCGIWDTRIVGPVFIQGTLNGERYLNMLRDYVLPTLLNPQGDFPTFFQQDGAPPHYATEVRQFLDEQFGGHWIGRRGPIEWPPRSPDLAPLDFYLWGHLKSIVYDVKINNVDHLCRRIEEACASVDPQILQRVQLDWQKRLRLCVQLNGGHIEHVL